MLMWTDWKSEIVSVLKLPELEYSNVFWFYIDWLNDLIIMTSYS